MQKKKSTKEQVRERLLARIGWLILCVLLVVILIAEFLMRPHKVFGIEATMFFNAWYGLFSCVFIILFSNLLGLILKRKASYYEASDNNKQNGLISKGKVK